LRRDFRSNQWLFAYGSLCDGGAPESRINELMRCHTRPLCRGQIRARLVPIRAWYPGAIADAHARLAGTLFQLQRPRLLLPQLDRYEGYLPHNPSSSTFIRQRMNVETEKGCITAWVYLLNWRYASYSLSPKAERRRRASRHDFGYTDDSSRRRYRYHGH